MGRDIYSKEVQKKIDKTHKDNQHNQGEKHPMAKLTEKQVKKIRRLYATGGHSQKQLAKMFGVSRIRVGKIINHKSWVWLK